MAQEQARAQGYLRGLEQALQDRGIPDPLAEVVARKRKAQGKLCGLLFPPLFGGQSYHELSRGRGWDKTLPSRILGALPKRKWVKQWQQLGQEMLAVLWQHGEDKSPATRSRWQWTWVADDSVFKKAGQHLGLVGRWWSGQEQLVQLGIDGLLLVVVIGEGKLVVPVDFEVHRPEPEGPGRPCRDQLTWLEVMLERTLTALQQRGLRLPAPLVADSWFGDSGLMGHVETASQGTVVGEGKSSYVFHWPMGAG